MRCLDGKGYWLIFEGRLNRLDAQHVIALLVHIDIARGLCGKRIAFEYMLLGIVVYGQSLFTTLI